MPAATTTDSSELVLFDPELAVDPGPDVEPGPAAGIPVSPGAERTAFSIVNRLRHPDSVRTPGRRPGDRLPPRKKMASPTASSSGTGSKARLATPSPNRYPTLRLLARDIYAIPISTVASESAFSTSGRVLSEHLSRLTSDLLEALMCSQDWIRNRYKDDDDGQEASFWSVLEDVEEGLEALKL